MVVGKIEPLRSYRLVALALFASAVPLVLVAILAQAPQVAFGLLHSFLFGAMAWSFAHRSVRGKVTRGELTVSDDVLALGGQTLARRAELGQGALVPDGERTLVRLERRGAFAPPLHLVVPDASAGGELLRALGFDAGSTASEMRIGSGVASLPVGTQFAWVLGPMAVTMVLCALVGSAFGPLAVPIALAGIAATIAVAFTPMKVRIGTDGIVTRWGRRERFVPFTEMKDASPFEEAHGRKQFFGVHVTLRSGEVVKLPTGRGELARSDSLRLAQRIAEARLAGQSTTTVKTALARGTRGASEWLKALRALGAGGDLRTPAIPREALLRVVEDGSLDGGTRVGAAIAALADADEPTAARIRSAANVSASPKLRIALERVAAPLDEGELAELLDDVEEEAAR